MQRGRCTTSAQGGNKESSTTQDSRIGKTGLTGLKRACDKPCLRSTIQKELAGRRYECRYRAMRSGDIERVTSAEHPLQRACGRLTGLVCRCALARASSPRTSTFRAPTPTPNTRADRTFYTTTTTNRIETVFGRLHCIESKTHEREGSRSDSHHGDSPRQRSQEQCAREQDGGAFTHQGPWAVK